MTAIISNQFNLCSPSLLLLFWSKSQTSYNLFLQISFFFLKTFLLYGVFDTGKEFVLQQIKSEASRLSLIRAALPHQSILSPTNLKGQLDFQSCSFDPFSLTLRPYWGNYYGLKIYMFLYRMWQGCWTSIQPVFPAFYEFPHWSLSR